MAGVAAKGIAANQRKIYVHDIPALSERFAVAVFGSVGAGEDRGDGMNK